MTSRALPCLAALATAVLAACGGDDAAGNDASAPADAALDADADAALPTPDASSAPLELTGAIVPVHDPAIIAVDGGFYVFGTGQGISVVRSPDLRAWTSAAQVFATKPSWITTTSASDPNHLWAPDVSYFGGQYHLYYSASSFGSNSSCIGHATAARLDPPAWVDSGGPVICSTASNAWNAIDPNLVIDGDGDPWLAFGSFWGGIKMIPLDGAGARLGTQMYSLATRDSTAVEAPYIVRRDGYYYLFESVDLCCRGAESTYRQMVGRATSVTGPYLDRGGVPLLAGGGTLLVEGDSRWRGPGHNAVLVTADAVYNAYHAYDALAGGAPTLRISPMTWSDDGWPISAGP